MDIVTGLGILKAASDLITRLREALKSGEVKPDEVMARIIEIQDLISDGRTALIDAQEVVISRNAEVQVLKDEVRRLTEAADLGRRVVFHDNACWKRLDDGAEEGPPCPSCWADRTLRRGQVLAVHKRQVVFIRSEHMDVFRFCVPEGLVQNYDLSATPRT